MSEPAGTVIPYSGGFWVEWPDGTRARLTGPRAEAMAYALAVAPSPARMRRERAYTPQEGPSRGEDKGMSQHTPGPWILAPYRERQRPIVMQGGTPRMICDVAGHSQDADTSANARLIAAAPDLLAALEAVMGGQIGGTPDMNTERFRLARAAIAKARGEDRGLKRGPKIAEGWHVCPRCYRPTRKRLDGRLMPHTTWTMAGGARRKVWCQDPAEAPRPKRHAAPRAGIRSTRGNTAGTTATGGGACAS